MVPAATSADRRADDHDDELDLVDDYDPELDLLDDLHAWDED